MADEARKSEWQRSKFGEQMRATNFGNRNRKSASPSHKISYRGVAQLGRALRSGRRSRKFESCHLDKNEKEGSSFLFVFLAVKAI